MSFFYRLMGWLLKTFCSLFNGNIALSIFLFTILINLVFFPLNVKQQKSMASQARIKNKMDKLKEKYKDDKVRYQEEVGNLYSSAGTNPMIGCLLTFIRLPFLLGVYWAIRRPLSYMFGIAEATITSAGATLGLKNPLDNELAIFNHLDKIPALSDLTGKLDFNLFGLDLTQTPDFSINIFKDFQAIWLIPLLSFATAMISSLVSMKMQKKINPEAGSSGMFLFLFMPFFSLYIAFNVPGAVGFYWACSNIVGMVINVVVQSLYSPAKVIASLEAKEMRARREFEQKKIAAVNAQSEQ